MLWLLWKQSQEWKTLPSAILRVDDWYDGWCIDQAVWSFGTELEQALAEAEASKKNERGKKAARAKVFNQWIPDAQADTPRLRDPGKENPEGLRR